MIRKLVLPIVAVALLGGCVTDYAYRGGDRGDYYYGQPTTEYRYYGPYGSYAPYGYGNFGYGNYGYGRFGYPHGYYGGYPFGYRGFYHYPPYYRHHHHRPPVTWRRPDGSPTPQQRSNNDGRPPWRNFDELRRRQSADGGGNRPREVVPSGPVGTPRDRDEGSRMEQVIRRANRNADTRRAEEEP